MKHLFHYILELVFEIISKLVTTQHDDHSVLCKPLVKFELCVVHMTQSVNLNFCFSKTSLIYTIKICSSIRNNKPYPHKALCYAQRTFNKKVKLKTVPLLRWDPD